MRPWLLAATLFAALFLAAVAFWMAGDEWEEYKEDAGAPRPATTGTPADHSGGPLPLQELIRTLHLPEDTRILEIEREQHEGRLLYELELLTPQGRVYELLVDPYSGEVVDMEEEDSDAFTAGGR